MSLIANIVYLAASALYNSLYTGNGHNNAHQILLIKANSNVNLRHHFIHEIKWSMKYINGPFRELLW